MVGRAGWSISHEIDESVEIRLFSAESGEFSDETASVERRDRSVEFGEFSSDVSDGFKRPMEICKGICCPMVLDCSILSLLSSASELAGVHLKYKNLMI